MTIQLLKPSNYTIWLYDHPTNHVTEIERKREERERERESDREKQTAIKERSRRRRDKEQERERDVETNSTKTQTLTQRKLIRRRGTYHILSYSRDLITRTC